VAVAGRIRARKTLDVSGLVGRQREVVELEAAIEKLLLGHGDLVVVSGDAGIGKTRLCEELAETAASRGVTVAWARCWEAATAAPLWPWTQLLRQLTDETIPEAHRLNPGEAPDLARMLFFDDVVARLSRVGAAHPLLLVIDDLQWADVASVRLLAYLASSRPGMVVLALAAYRSGELSARTSLGEEVVALSRCGRHIPLGPLGVEDVKGLVRSVTTRHVKSTQPSCITSPEATRCSRGNWSGSSTPRDPSVA